MFKITDQHLFWWPATARQPDNARPGEFAEQTFKLYFRELSPEQVSAIEREANKSGKPQAFETSLLKASVQGWSDVVGENDSPVTFSATNLDMALQFAAFRIAAFRAYTEAMNGEAARLGN